MGVLLDDGQAEALILILLDKAGDLEVCIAAGGDDSAGTLAARLRTVDSLLVVLTGRNSEPRIPKDRRQ